MIPAFGKRGNLPPGLHETTWQEFVSHFGGNRHRKMLLEGLEQALEVLRAAGCKRAYIDGSFVTRKRRPADFDGCWDTAGVDLRRLDPVLLTFGQGRAAQKAKYRGELFPARLTEGGSGVSFLEFFQTDRETGAPKGIVVLRLQE